MGLPKRSPWTCPDCFKSLTTSSGYNSHRRRGYCKGPKRTYDQLAPGDMVSKIENMRIIYQDYSSDEDIDDDQPHGTRMSIEIGKESANQEDETLNSDSNFDSDSDSDSVASNLFDQTSMREELGFDLDEHRKDGIKDWNQTWQQKFGKLAGQPIEGVARKAVDQPSYRPFKNAYKYDYAKMLLDGEMSRTWIDKWCKGAFGPLRTKGTRIDSADDLFKIINDIPYGIRSSEWIHKLIDVRVGGRLERHTIRFIDPIRIIRFLIGHQPFVDHLAYQPVRMYRDGMRVYNEMHTGDWWWEKQTRLTTPERENPTIVPVIIGVDKTLMTTFVGDSTIWPIYMTIGNLDNKTRRAHDCPGMLLMGMLPMITASDENKKVDPYLSHIVYHEALRYIFQSEYCTYWSDE